MMYYVIFWLERWGFATGVTGLYQFIQMNSLRGLLMSTRKKNRAIMAPFVFTALSLLTFSIPAMAADGVTWKKIIDFGYPGYAEIGIAWRTYCSPPGTAHDGCYRYLSHYDYTRERVGLATWTTAVPYSGIYKVSVSYRSTENRSPDADYFVINSEGANDHFVVNQTGEGSLVWKTLGQYHYTKGQNAKVVLDGTDDTYSDCADAVSWELVELDPDPKIGPATNLLLLGN